MAIANDEDGDGNNMYDGFPFGSLTAATRCLKIEARLPYTSISISDIVMVYGVYINFFAFLSVSLELACLNDSISGIFSLLQFFMTKPLPCDPSTLPKYPPTKEFDVKFQDENARR